MNYIRNFFGWGAQKNIDNAQPNKVEKEFDGFEIFEKSQLTAPEQNYISKALNIRNMSNNIVSGIKKITSGVLDIVNYANPFNKAPANNKTPQQRAVMLSDNKNIQDLTEKVKLYFGIDDTYIKGEKSNKFAKEIIKLKKRNNYLLGENEKLKNSKRLLDTLKKSANLCLISKNKAEILHNYICLAYAKTSNEGRDKQQMQYLSHVNDVAEKIAKKYENHAKNIFGEISNLENLLKKTKNPEKKHNELKTKRGLNQNANKGNLNKKISGKKDAMLKRPGVRNISTPKLPKEIVDNNDKPHALKNYINSKLFENESTEESSTSHDTDINNKLQALEDDIDDESIEIGSTEENSVFDDFDTDTDSIKNEYNKAKVKYNEQKKELSELEKNQRTFNDFFAQYGQNNVSDEELEELRKQL